MTNLTTNRKWIYIGLSLLVVALCLVSIPRYMGSKDVKQTPQKEKSPSSDTEPDSPKNLEQDKDVETYAAELPESEFDGQLNSGKAYLEVQSPARPFGLDIVDEVQAGGSDPNSQDFLENSLPDILNFIGNNGNNAVAVAPDTEAEFLTLKNPADVRVYFVADNGAYHNSLGMFSGENVDAALLFPDASSTYSDGQGNGTSEDYPVLPGDFIDIGSVESGSYLDLFIIPQGASEEASDAYVTDKSLNEDQTSHMKVLGYVDNSIVIGFEDMKNGGDQDYLDVVIAVDVGEGNLEPIAAELEK